MAEFIDIHTHILPGVDDGAQELRQAMEMLHLAWEDGTRTVVLTPHYRGEYRKHTPQQLRDRFDAFAAQAAQALPGLRLVLGQEVCCTPEAPEALADGRALSLGGTGFVLLEFPVMASRESICKSVESLRFYGYRPVVAHAERCRVLRRDRSLLSWLQDNGALFQLNAEGVLGKYGWGAKAFCRQLLKGRAADFVASDAHDPRIRPPLLGKCHAYIAKKYGQEYAGMLFCENAKTMLNL